VDTPRPSPRTNRTRRVPHPVLIGHAASLSQVCAAHPSDHGEGARPRGRAQGRRGQRIFRWVRRRLVFVRGYGPTPPRAPAAPCPLLSGSLLGESILRGERGWSRERSKTAFKVQRSTRPPAAAPAACSLLTVPEPHRRQVSLFKVEGENGSNGSPDEGMAAHGPDALPLPSTQGRAYDLTKVRAPWLRPACIRILVFCCRRAFFLSCFLVAVVSDFLSRSLSLRWTRSSESGCSRTGYRPSARGSASR
jgi:hypothetical protein